MSKSRANYPDLDWSQIKETIAMLNLAMAQIDISLSEGDDNMNSLAGSLTEVAGSLDVIINTAQEDSGDEECQLIKDAIVSQAQANTGIIHNAVIALQFYDKMVQRLNHVTNSLSSLSTIVGDEKRIYNPYEWSALQKRIQSGYTMEEERLMFEEIVNGASVEEALAVSRELVRKKQEDEDDLELF